MNLFKRGDRRYTHAKESEILAISSEIVSRFDPYLAGKLSGMSDVLLYQEEHALIEDVKRDLENPQTEGA